MKASMEAKDEVKVDHVDELAMELAMVLQRPDIDTTKEIINHLLQDPSKLVLRTTRLKKLPLDKLHLFFNVEHHIEAATSFFKKYRTFGEDTRAVVFGHKNQGKTQFLYFLAKLLQALGEGVVYLDKSIVPGENEKLTDVEDDGCCLHKWQQELLVFLGQNEGAEKVKSALEQFAAEGRRESFGEFHTALRSCVRRHKLRVWMIVDEAATEEIGSFPIVLPKEQTPSNFHFVLTGSVGIARFTSDRHLDKWVWDLPLFTPAKAAVLAVKLHAALQLEGVDLWDALGVKRSPANPAAFDLEHLGAALEELFGGVPGYIAELLLELSKGHSLSTYTLELSSRRPRSEASQTGRSQRGGCTRCRRRKTRGPACATRACAAQPPREASSSP